MATNPRGTAVAERGSPVNADTHEAGKCVAAQAWVIVALGAAYTFPMWLWRPLWGTDLTAPTRSHKSITTTTTRTPTDVAIGVYLSLLTINLTLVSQIGNTHRVISNDRLRHSMPALHTNLSSALVSQAFNAHSNIFKLLYCKFFFKNCNLQMPPKSPIVQYPLQLRRCDPTHMHTSQGWPVRDVVCRARIDLLFSRVGPSCAELS